MSGRHPGAEPPRGERHPPPAPDRPDWADVPEEEYRQLQDHEWEDPSLPNTAPSGGTVIADRADARARHEADAVEPGTEEAAPEGPVSASVAEHYRDAVERGARVEGEGRI